jgi:hypothetical protein
MTWNSVTPLQSIKTFLAGLSGVQSAHIGAPESFTTRVTAYVCLGSDGTMDHRTEVQRGEVGYFCAFGYRVQGAEEAAEIALATAKDDLKQQWTDDRTAGTGVFALSTTQAKGARLDLNLAAIPDYAPVAGVEYRLWPFMIYVMQENVFSA